MNLTALLDQELRVPIQRVRAEIHTEREQTNGHLLLAPLATIEEVFEDRAQFVPVEIDGRARLLSRASISLVVVDEEPTSGTQRNLRVMYGFQAVVVRLTNGVVIEGNIVLSPTLRRTLDVLNESTKSFAVYGGGKVQHVAKAHVLRVEEAT